MKTLFKLLGALCLVVVGILFNAWIWSTLYDLGVYPVATNIGVNLPDIPWQYFMIIPIIGMNFTGKITKSYQLDDPELWATFLGSNLVKLICVLCIYVFNSMVF